MLLRLAVKPVYDIPYSYTVVVLLRISYVVGYHSLRYGPVLPAWYTLQLGLDDRDDTKHGTAWTAGVAVCEPALIVSMFRIHPFLSGPLHSGQPSVSPVYPLGVDKRYLRICQHDMRRLCAQHQAKCQYLHNGVNQVCP